MRKKSRKSGGKILVVLAVLFGLASSLSIFGQVNVWVESPGDDCDKFWAGTVCAQWEDSMGVVATCCIPADKVGTSDIDAAPSYRCLGGLSARDLIDAMP